MITTINEYLLLKEKSVKKSDRIDIYRDNNYIVVRPLTHEASCKYGAYTGWCTSVPVAKYIWDEYPDNILIIIIQRNYKKSEADKKLSRELTGLNDKFLSGDLNDEERDRYEELINDQDTLNLEKIALTFNKNGYCNSIWDMDNIDISDVYDKDYRRLPIDSKVLDEIGYYISMVSNVSEARTHINDNPDIVLFVKENQYTRDFVLTNPINKAVYGYCSLYNRTALYDEINRAVAIQNYGPLLMDCILMYEYNINWCRPSRSIEPDAQKLFRYYLQNRKSELELKQRIHD